MKRCPRCNQSFDATNDFCLNDGTRLVVDSASQETFLFPRGINMPTSAGVSPRTSGSQWVTFAIILVLAVVAVGFGVAFFMSKERENEKSDTNTRPTATPEATRAVAAVTPRMTPVPPPPSLPLSMTQQPVTVNSPRDGFLALRSEPNHRSGSQLRRIPHGTALMLGACVPNLQTIDGRKGRWCQVQYEGETGWIFTAWIR